MATSSTSSDDCSAFIAAHDDAELLESGKVRCKVTGHEMPQRLALLEQYWAGSKYANAKKRAAYDFAQHEPWIVAHKKSATLLYCTLTKSPVSKEAKAVQGHINGKRFKRLLAEALNPPEKKKKRPRDDDDDEDDDEDEGEDVEDEEAAGEEAEEMVMTPPSFLRRALSGRRRSRMERRTMRRQSRRRTTTRRPFGCAAAERCRRKSRKPRAARSRRR